MLLHYLNKPIMMTSGTERILKAKNVSSRETGEEGMADRSSVTLILRNDRVYDKNKLVINWFTL